MTSETKLRAGQRAPRAGLYRSKNTGERVTMSKDEKLPAGGAWQFVETSEGIDPLTGLTDAELAGIAEQAEGERDDPENGEEIPAPEISRDVRSVVSVRFNPGELTAIEAAARSAGVPLSTFIRNAALNTASPVNVEQLRGAVSKLQSDVLADLTVITGVLGMTGHLAEVLSRLVKNLPAAK